ncbi:DUF6179 domain-containing protein [Floccifex sp.]|uniref:DUF6179 domain-containing protein n=1 Tax=Floccifex sp. TaxID=2815810 RepID=UPI003F0456C4
MKPGLYIETQNFDLQLLFQDLVLSFNKNQSTSLSQDDALLIWNTIEYMCQHGSTQKQIRDTFYDGWKMVQEDALKIQQLLNQLQSNLLPFSNEKYKNILFEQIPRFLQTLKGKDSLFHYCQLTEDLDYPLFDGFAFDHDMYQRKGSDCVLYYLKRFSLEQSFCITFKKDIPELVSQFEKRYKISIEETNINLFSILLYQDIAHILLYNEPGILLKKEEIKKLRKINISKKIPSILKTISTNPEIKEYILSFQDEILQSFELFKNHKKELFLYPPEIIKQYQIHFSYGQNQKEFTQTLLQFKEMKPEKRFEMLQNKSINIYDLMDLLEQDILFENQYQIFYSSLQSVDIAILLKAMCICDTAFDTQITMKDIYEQLDMTQEWQYQLYKYLQKTNTKKIEKYIHQIQIE